MRLAWLFLGWILIEIGLFVTLGGRIGLFGTWFEVLASGVGGIMLIRQQKRHMLGQVMRDLRGFGDLMTPAAHSALIVLAGVLLILPGFLTDAVGLILLILMVVSMPIYTRVLQATGKQAPRPSIVARPVTVKIAFANPIFAVDTRPVISGLTGTSGASNRKMAR